MMRRRSQLNAPRPFTPRGLRAAGSVGISLCSVVLLLLGAAAVLSLGPSAELRGLFVTTVTETSALKFLAHLFLTPEQVEAVIAGNGVAPIDDVTDSDSVEVDIPADDSRGDIEVVDVSGATFRGKMMIVRDPSRLYVGTLPEFSEEKGGLRVEEMIERDGAAAGINGGGFQDIGGVGTGGVPLGIVIKGGVLVFGDPGVKTDVVGFDRDCKLVVGRMTGSEALARGVIEALTFGPTLIVNGVPAEIRGTGGGLNPRTAIGQRENGEMLLLVIDGRQANSLGGSYRDIIDVMLEFGAVNAGNLDGGSSTVMFWGGELLNTCASLYGSRKMPTAILVR